MADCSGTVHVALGKGLKKGKMILDWVFENLRGMEIVILHVHRPPKLIPMQMGGRFPVNLASPEEAERYITKKRAEMKKILSSFLNLCAGKKIPAKELVIEAEDIHRGILYLVGQHRIKKIVLGLRSIKEQPILDSGLLSCQIWLISNGKLVFTRFPLLQPISVEFSGSESPEFSAPSSNESGGSSDFQSEHQAKEDRGSAREELKDENVGNFLQARLSQEANVIPRKLADLDREEEESDDDFIEFSLPEIEEAAAKWLVQNGDLGR